MNKKILIVDDEFDMLHLLKRSLEPDLDCRIDTASSGKDALEMISQQAFDLVLADIKMPEMNGLELLELIKRDYPDQTVVMMTAFGGIETAVKAMRNGAYDFITKPFDHETLLVRLETPRFLVVGDVATLSASIHNHTDEKLAVSASLQASGLSIEERTDTLSIGARGQGRVEWKASAKQAGDATLEVRVSGGDLSDAVRRSLPIHTHGIEKLEAAAGKLRGAELRAHLNLPAERRSTRSCC